MAASPQYAHLHIGSKSYPTGSLAPTTPFALIATGPAPAGRAGALQPFSERRTTRWPR